MKHLTRNLQKKPTLRDLARCAGLGVCLCLCFLFLFPGSSAHAQSNERRSFIPLGKVPQLIQPGGAAPARFFSKTTRVLFYVNADSLDQSISANLSSACALEKFNQKKVGRYYVLIETENGKRRRLGFASSEGFNLRDPGNRKGRDLAFLFEYDGTSECRVYAIPTIF